jgi:hypothetical protein
MSGNDYCITRYATSPSQKSHAGGCTFSLTLNVQGDSMSVKPTPTLVVCDGRPSPLDWYAEDGVALLALACCGSGTADHSLQALAAVLGGTQDASDSALRGRREREAPEDGPLPQRQTMPASAPVRAKRYGRAYFARAGRSDGAVTRPARALYDHTSD